MENKFLTRTEFSKIMGVSLSTLYREVRKNAWPFNAYVKIGDHIRYPAALVAEIEQKALSKRIEG
jgi:predicted DNA-binding transcriptional regulator AlpA